MERYFEDILHELKKITQMNEQEIISFVRSNCISYEDLKVFYLRECRLPNAEECLAIHLMNKIKF